MRRLALLPLLLVLTACPKGTPADGAVKLTVSYKGFVPRCVRVSVKDVEVTQETRTTELPGKGDASGGALTVAIFREPSWGHTLELTAEVFERVKDARCEGEPALRQSRSVTVGTKVEEPTLLLEAMDADGDGFLSVTALVAGSDCDDSLASVHPGAVETCNGRDDDCNGKKDDDFAVGLACDGSNGCQGAWACDSTGGRECKVVENQWYPDSDGDGYGAKSGAPLNACKQPLGYAPNNGDCDDGDDKRHPGAVERCNAVDEDCDDNPVNGFSVGVACGNGACMGVSVCSADESTVECNAPTPLIRYRDTDGDGHGAQGTPPVTLCQPPESGFAESNDDCDDTNPQRHPGAMERCNDVDEDCDGNPTNGFDVGASCTPPASGCTGELACDAQGGLSCKTLTEPTEWYLDEDLDTYGKQGDPIMACSAPDAGYAARGGDCDDGDPFTHTGARELCDRKDNDCDGSIEDASVCPANPRWKETIVGSNARTWNAISLYGDGGVWVVGTHDGRALKTPQSSTFTPFESGCSGIWYSVWADPVTGKAYIGGANNTVASQGVGDTTCVFNNKGKDITYGLRGFRAPDGRLDIYGVGARANDSAGWTTRWNGGDKNPDINTTAAEDPLHSVSGTSPEVLFAVGGADLGLLGTHPRVYRFDTSTQTWKEQSTPTTGLNFLYDVWVVNSKLAYAGGRAGTVLKWNGTNWGPLPAPNGNNVTGILAFGSSAVYAVTNGGEVLRYNGQSWTQLHDFGVPLQDINGRSPEDIWVVGSGGRIIHWPD